MAAKLVGQHKTLVFPNWYFPFYPVPTRDVFGGPALISPPLETSAPGPIDAWDEMPPLPPGAEIPSSRPGAHPTPAERTARSWLFPQGESTEVSRLAADPIPEAAGNEAWTTLTRRDRNGRRPQRLPPNVVRALQSRSLR